jgi:hypothetical protein
VQFWWRSWHFISSALIVHSSLFLGHETISRTVCSDAWQGIYQYLCSIRISCLHYIYASFLEWYMK